MDIRFLEPGFLALLPLIAALWFWPRRVRTAADRRAFGLRAAALALLVLAIARPVVGADAERAHAVVVLDGPAARPSAEVFDLVDDARRATLVTIGATQLGEDDLERFDAVVRLAPDGARSPLGDALERAAAAVPTGVPGAIVLVTDGRATAPDFGAAVAALAERGVPVFVRALDGAARDGVPIAVEPLGRLRVGHAARVRVRGLGAANGVQLVGPDGVLAEAPATNAEDGRFDALLEFEPPSAGFLEVTAVADGATFDAVLAIDDPLEVLYVGGRVEGGANALGGLLGPGFAVRAAAAPSDGDLVPGGEGEGEGDAPFDAVLGDAPLVVLDDVAAQSLPEGLLDALAERVENRGTGLVMSGGSSAFGPGGYADTAIERVMPVEFVQREEKRDPSTTLVVIIDTSGSMGGERVQLAKEVARLSIQRLLPHDKVGIVEFYGAKRWAAPIQPASNHIELERALNRLDAGGGTVILPAIEEAFYGLQNIETRYKHVLVLTDGGVERGAFEPLLRRMADKGMTVSTVLVGGNLHSEFLVDIANWGKGRFYSVPNRFNIPEILLKQPTSAQLPSYRTGSYSVEAQGGSVWWGGERPDAVPPVMGYVETEARPGADVVLRIGETGQPLAASWMWGAGRVGAFATEPVGAGTESWSAWPGYGRFLGRFMARCAAPDPGPFDFGFRRQGHEVVALATARHAGARDARPAVRADGRARFDFAELAPGVFEARAVVAPTEALRVEAGVAGPDGAPTGFLARHAIPSGHAPEGAVDPRAELRTDAVLAATGGGRLGATALRADSLTATRHLTRLAPWLALLALLVHLLDVLLRRLDRGAGVVPSSR